jgi:hypothetical protein
LITVDFLRSLYACLNLLLPKLSKAMRAVFQPFLVVLICLLLSACGDSSDSDNRLGRVDVIPGTAEIGVGENLQLEIEGVLNDGQLQYISPTAVDWLSNDTSIATVTAAGLVTATCEGVANLAALTVEASTATGLIIEPAVITVGKKSIMQYQALLQFGGGPIQNVTDDAVWGTNDKKVAKVDSSKNRGKVTAESEGSTQITAGYEDSNGLFTAASDITVTAECTETGGNDIESLTITTDPSNPDADPPVTTVGGVVQLHAIVTYVDGCSSIFFEKNGLNWKSLDKDVVDVSKKGEVTGLEVGAGDVEAKIKGETTIITITVVDP